MWEEADFAATGQLLLEDSNDATASIACVEPNGGMPAGSCSAILARDTLMSMHRASPELVEYFSLKLEEGVPIRAIGPRDDGKVGLTAGLVICLDRLAMAIARKYAT